LNLIFILPLGVDEAEEESQKFLKDQIVENMTQSDRHHNKGHYDDYYDDYYYEEEPFNSVSSRYGSSSSMF
jgi:hypothetical protein